MTQPDVGYVELPAPRADVVQADSTPTAKVTMATLTAALTTVLLAVAGSLGVELEAEQAGAIVTAVAFIAGYLKTSRPGDNDR